MQGQTASQDDNTDNNEGLSIGQELQMLSHRTNENFISVDRALEELHRRLDAINDTIGKMQERKPPQVSPDIIEDINRRIDGIENRLSVQDFTPSGAVVETRSTEDMPPDMISQLRDIRDDLREMKRYHTKSRLNFFEIEKRLMKLESGESHTEHAKHHSAPALERRIKIMEEKFEEKIKSIEDIMMLLEVELVKARGVPFADIPSAYEDRLKVLEQKMNGIEKAKLGMPAESLALASRLKNLEENIVSLEARTKNQLNETENRILASVSGPGMSSEAAGTLLGKLSEEMRQIRLDVEEAKILRAHLEELKGITPRKEHVEQINADVTRQIALLKEQVERIISSGKTAGAKSVEIESDLKRQFDDYKRFLDSRIVRMEEKIHDVVADEARKIMLTEEAQSIIKRLEALENEVEQRAYSIVVKELETFAEAIDKKFPDLVTKEDMGRIAHSRTPLPAKPDIAPVMERLSSLEDRLDELAEYLRQTQGAAVVVE